MTIISTGSHISCPFNSADFLNNIDQIMAERFSAKTEQDCRDLECEYAADSLLNFHLRKSAVCFARVCVLSSSTLITIVIIIHMNICTY